MKWQVLSKNKNIVKALLENRGIKNKKEFFNPTNPMKIGMKELGVSDESVKRVVKRIKRAKDKKEQVIVYGDYDADGITATAIMWEALHELGLDVLPHIPDRFEEGYGINAKSVENLATKSGSVSQTPNLKLIVTVDNGIVGYEGIKTANKLGIDVIIIDHHTKGSQRPSTPYILHTTKVSGSALAWFFARELLKKFESVKEKLQLAAIGTIADQLPLIGVNRSIVKYGLEELNKTKRPGLLALFREAGLVKNVGPAVSVGTYEVGYIIAPRINAMGRLKHGLESLRLLCTKDKTKAFEIAKNIGGTNSERQRIVEEVVILARKNVTDQKIIVIAGENYHEGVIGLAAAKLVEEFYRPAVVLSKKGDTAKASARSISGFDIIEAIRAVSLHLEGGGHPMAAGFSIETNKIELFTKEINKYADKLLTDTLLERKLKIDCEVDFNQLNYELLKELKKFEPTGLGNFTPTFTTKNVEVAEAKLVGRESKHIKFKLRQNEHIFDSIYFGGGEMYSKLTPKAKIDIAYCLEDNFWNGYKNLQLKIKDIKLDFN